MDYKFLHLVRDDCPLPPGTHVVALARDSGGDEQEKSVTQQAQAYIEYCNYHKLILDRVYADEAKTGSNTENREELQDMLDSLRTQFPQIHDRYKREQKREREPFGILVWKGNRLGRDQIEIQFIRSDLRMRGVTIIEMLPAIETDDPGLNMIAETFQDWQDQQLLDAISQDAKRGQAYFVGMRDTNPEFRAHNPEWPTNDGRYLSIYPGKPPTGFTTEEVVVGYRDRKKGREPRTRQRIVPDKESGLWGRCYQAWEMRRNGATYKEIHEATKLLGSMSSYTTFFKNQIYTGDLDYGGKLYVDFVEALIPREWFEDEQKKIKERAKKKKSRRMDPNYEPRRVASEALLSGLLYCGGNEQEEHPMYADRSGNWLCYRCSVEKNTRGDKCTAPRISMAATDQAVIDKLMSEVLTFENLQPLGQQIGEAVLSRNASYHEQIASKKSQLGEIRIKITRLLDAIEDGRYSAHIAARIDSHEDEEKYLLEEIALLEENIVDPEDVPDVSAEQLREFIAHMRQTLEQGDRQIAREAMRRFVAKVVVDTESKTGHVYYTFPLSNEPRLRNVPPRGLGITSSFKDPGRRPALPRQAPC